MSVSECSATTRTAMLSERVQGNVMVKKIRLGSRHDETTAMTDSCCDIERIAAASWPSLLDGDLSR
jgi:hypothetical protein